MEKEKEIEIEDIPLSNKEVYEVLIAKNEKGKNKEIFLYLESVKETFQKYNLEALRNIKNKLDADMMTLTMVANISDISILSESDREQVKKQI